MHTVSRRVYQSYATVQYHFPRPCYRRHNWTPCYSEAMLKPPHSSLSMNSVLFASQNPQNYRKRLERDFSLWFCLLWTTDGSEFTAAYSFPPKHQNPSNVLLIKSINYGLGVDSDLALIVNLIQTSVFSHRHELSPLFP